MRTPDFWFRPPGLRARLLAPLGALYARGTARRVARPGWRAPVPVICVGNLNAGGTGKTPTVIALAQRLLEEGRKPHILSRGHGGRIKTATRVDPMQHSARDVGDEPLLLAAFAPVWIGRDRAETARAACDAGADCLLMDDGHQNPGLTKDLTLIVADAQKGFGNGLCLPAGPLREPIAAGLARADAVLSLGPATDQAQFAARWGARIAPLPHLRAALEPLPTGLPWEQMRAFAFAGIGHPEKFFDTLRGLGVDLVHGEALADHQALAPALIVRLMRDAAAAGAQLVTTEKDAVRLPQELRNQILTLPVRLAWQDPGALDTLLRPVLDHSASNSSRSAAKSS